MSLRTHTNFIYTEGIMKFLKLAGVLLASSLLTSTTAHAADNYGPWQVRVRAIVVAPDDSATITPIGGDTDHSTQIVPEIDISYFFTDNISVEVIAGVTKHRGTAVNTALGDIDLGKVWVLPPTVTLQYHMAPGSVFNPYVGAGLNYTLFFGEDNLPAGSPIVDIDHDASFGVALQAGVDIQVNPDSDWFWNLDVKKIWMNTETTIDAGALGIVKADVNLDPWVFGAGFGRRF